MPGVREQVQALRPLIEARADDIEAQRSLPTDIVDALRAAGAFSLAAAKVDGGLELSPREQAEVIEDLSTIDASVGWCVMIGTDGPYYGSFMVPEAARALWPRADLVTAGMPQPIGRGVERDGGYVVSGRWAFGSGSTHADVIVGGFVVTDGDRPRLREDGALDWRIAVAPASSWEVLDTWYTTGLAGSGSNDYTVTDLFVAADRTYTFYDAPRRDEPLYQFPGMFLTNMPGVPLGIARAAIDIASAIAIDKLVVPEFQLMKDMPRVQSAIAHAEASLAAARSYAYATLDEVWARLCGGDLPTPEQRRALLLSRAFACRTGRDVVQAMADVVGAGSIYRSHPLDRRVRDAITVSQHITAQERVFEMAGRMRFGEPSPLPIF
jgi:alkylation response protein AidB-like acyl-CoA dehydrogenase